MKRKFTLVVMLACGFLAAQTRFVPNQLIVKLDAGNYAQTNVDLKQHRFGLPDLDAANTAAGVTKLSQIGQHRNTRTFLVDFPAGTSVEAQAEIYRAMGIFEAVTPNYYGSAAGQESEIVPSDTRFNRQWSFYNVGEGQIGAGPGEKVADADVDMDLAWDLETGDPDMIIATIDGGARMGHPDFASRIWTNPAETLNGIDDDGNGLIDDVNGWDFFFGDNDPTDERGHGSNVNGIIGAVANNANLYAGANWNSKVMVLKAIDYDLNATYASVANAVYYAVDNGAKIVNMSLGFTPPSTILEDFIAYAENHGVIITAAMMNFNNDTVYYPAGYSTTHGNVIACGATSPNDYRTVPFDWSATSGSNFGPHINVVAPGSYIYNLAFYSDTVFTVYWSGTSMATPLVASIASLVWAAAPELTPAQVRQIIEDTAQDQVGNPAEDVAGFDPYMGHGRANAFQAVSAAQQLARSQFTPSTQEFSVINPVKGDVLQLFSNGLYTGEYRMVVLETGGKTIMDIQVTLKAGQNELPFALQAGNYVVTLSGAKYQKILKIVKP